MSGPTVSAPAPGGDSPRHRGAAPARGDRPAARPAALPPLPRVRPGHARKFLVLAELLNVRPQDLLNWHLDELLRDLYLPDSGLLINWAEDMIEYADAGDKARVTARLNAWLARRAAALTRRASGHGKEAA